MAIRGFERSVLLTFYSSSGLSDFSGSRTSTKHMSYKIYLYDTDTDCIGSGTLSSAYVQSQLEAANGQDVEVHISSVGGSAFDAIAIYDDPQADGGYRRQCRRIT